jgi:uncharacterized protein YqeY
MLINKLRSDLLLARKNRHPVSTSLLTALVGETTMIGKNAGNRETTDDEAIAMIRKFLKNAEETLARQIESNRQIDVTKHEIEILKDYLPQQLSLEDIHNIVVNMKANDPKLSVGTAMKLLKEQHGGKYDGKIASGIVKAVIGQ